MSSKLQLLWYKGAAVVAWGLLTVVALIAAAAPASAVPIFAERYGFSCSACHTAVPDLNAFGNAFRRAGFRLPNAPRHHDFPLALRFQNTYMKDLLPSQNRRFNNLAVAISTANFGRDDSDSYFVRYFFGSQTAAGSLYYAWVQHVSPVNGNFLRFGLFNLPLIANATQRLDTITTMPVYAYTVGHSYANFTTPRWGMMFGQRNDRIDTEIALADDEYHGAAYGAPTPPSDLVQSFARPEIFFSSLVTLPAGFKAGVLALNGDRAFASRTSSQRFNDQYYRDGVQAGWTGGRFEVTAQQVWGHDNNADGFGNATGSSGGFVTLKYHATPHAYVGIRYDAVANPFASRDYDVYLVFPPTVHSRIVIEHFHPIGNPSAISITSAQLLFALPFPEWVSRR